MEHMISKVVLGDRKILREPVAIVDLNPAVSAEEFMDLMRKGSWEMDPVTDDMPEPEALADESFASESEAEATETPEQPEPKTDDVPDPDILPEPHPSKRGKGKG